MVKVSVTHKCKNLVTCLELGHHFVVDGLDVVLYCRDGALHGASAVQEEADINLRRQHLQRYLTKGDKRRREEQHNSKEKETQP